MTQELIGALKEACQKLYSSEVEPELTRPDEKFGDYATNVALQLAKRLGKNPREVADALALEARNIPGVAQASVAGPGFLNIKLTDEKLAEALNRVIDLPKPLAGQEIVLEHTDPNPFKEFHIGHAYSNTVGVSIGKILQSAGAKVHQVTYQGDVGLHIAMAIFGLKNPENQNDLGLSYATGARAYSDDLAAKKEIDRINTHLYSRDDPEINRLYDEGRARSLKAFEKIYQKLGAEFEKNYFESDTAVEGVEIVRKNVGEIFEESDGAIVFKGEKAGLHTRVFITSQNLPTYEAKEIGLAFAKLRDYPSAQKFIVITGNEIDDYFNVLLAAIKEIDASLAGKITHLSHGMVRFAEGKMSSRTGNVVTFVDLESNLKAKTEKMYGGNKNISEIVLGAIKYEFLKHRLGSDFIFDPGEAVRLEGNSGPYLQYAHARACSIIQKAGGPSDEGKIGDLEPGERTLARKISEYSEVVAKATAELMPHYICTYLYELAQEFNRFYEGNRIIGDNRQATRLALVKIYANVLKNGLNLLNITAPERM